MKAKKLTAMGLAAVMTVSMGNTVFAGELGLEAHSDQTYYMVTFLSGYSFWTECWRGFQDAAELLGVEAKYGGSTEYDVNSAVTSLEQVIALKPTGMAVTCMDADAYKDPINKAIESGIPIVTFDSDSPESNRTTFIGTSNYDAGVTAADYIGEQLGGKGRVACLTRTGQSNINERIEGFTTQLAAKYPDIEMVQVVDAGNDENEAATNLSSLLSTDSDIDYIFAALQQAVLGTETALAEAGLTGEVKVVGFDTDTTTLDSIKSGSVEATLSQSPYAEGFWSMIYTYMLCNQEYIKSADDWYAKGFPSLPASCDSGCAVVTAENADMYYISE
ncbi:MAG: substrate-binding domain-containing protein [Eubacteriales bacterium]|nr:substrate-binding domain-containing protein [Eubacteriales bacterium]